MNDEEEKIWKLKDELNKNNLNLANIRRQIRQLADFDETKEYEYLNALLYPEKIKGVRIPSKTPIPTCTFQLHSSIINSLSNPARAIYMITPYFLGETFPTDGSLGMYIDMLDSGVLTKKYIKFEYAMGPSAKNIQPTASDNNFIDLQQYIDKGIYSMYRLVSACLTVQYIGDISQSKGTIGGGIYINDSNYLSGVVGIYNTPTSSKLSNAGLENKLGEINQGASNPNPIRHLTYSSENSCLEGVRLLYFPIDNWSLEFKKLFNCSRIYQVGYANFQDRQNSIMLDSDDYDGRFLWAVFVNEFPGSCKVKIDLYCNFECVPDYKMLNYIPISVNGVSIPEEVLNEIWKKIRNQSVGKLI